MRVALDSFERCQQWPARTIAGARFAHRFCSAADQLARPSGMLGQYAVNVAGQRDVAAFLDIERPLAAPLEAAGMQLGQKLEEYRHAGPARGFEVAALTEESARRSAESASSSIDGQVVKSTSSNPVPSVAEPHALKRERRAIGRLRQRVDHYDTRLVEIAQYVTNLVDVADAIVTDLVEIASGRFAL